MSKLSKLVNISLLSIVFIYPVHSNAKVLSMAEIEDHFELVRKYMDEGDDQKAIKHLEIIANSDITPKNRKIIATFQESLGYMYLKDAKTAKRAMLFFKKSCKNGNQKACSLVE